MVLYGVRLLLIKKKVLHCLFTFSLEVALSLHLERCHSLACKCFIWLSMFHELTEKYLLLMKQLQITKDCLTGISLLISLLHPTVTYNDLVEVAYQMCYLY